MSIDEIKRAAQITKAYAEDWDGIRSPLRQQSQSKVNHVKAEVSTFPLFKSGNTMPLKQNLRNSGTLRPYPNYISS